VDGYYSFNFKINILNNMDKNVSLDDLIKKEKSKKKQGAANSFGAFGQ
jgi:hypothetical protein